MAVVAGGLVVAAGVEGEFSDQFAGVFGDDADVEFADEHEDSGAGPNHNPNQETANRLNALAAATFDDGSAARDNADRYVRDTVLFASVLFLVAVAQRFKAQRARLAVGVIAFALLTFVVISVAQLPRLS